MIYSFEIGDRRIATFTEILKESNIDYELVEYDRAVIRILGYLDEQLQQRLTPVAALPTKLHLKRAPEPDSMQDFNDKKKLALIAGPCAVESESQIEQTVVFLATLGIRYLRGGSFKPRTSCDSFQGLGKPGLELLRKYADRHEMFVVSEVMDRSQISIVAEYADILQVGSRNMFNYTLLAALGAINRPVLLKRGMGARIDEWLASANYINRGGNRNLILCERGIRTFELQTTHTLDLAAVCLAQAQTNYPVIADTSHACGRTDLVAPLAAAAVAAGADGIMVEVHPRSDQALSDSQQALSFKQFEQLLRRVRKIEKIQAE